MGHYSVSWVLAAVVLVHALGVFPMALWKWELSVLSCRSSDAIPLSLHWGRDYMVLDFLITFTRDMQRAT